MFYDQIAFVVPSRTRRHSGKRKAGEESGKKRRGFRLLVTAMSLALVIPLAVAANNPVDLTELSLEDLMNIEVTSVSRKPQQLSEAAAAVYVLTGEEIRRSPSSSIPDALRMVPGVQVAKIDCNKWAVTARGFNGNFANKLLVLIDGRSVYTPLFSGVYWDAQDVPLEDVDRIEVIRGPGATLWGANAVNGVINIITKTPEETTGGILSLSTGSTERGLGTFRYGRAYGTDLSFRVYGKFFDRDNAVFPNGAEASDHWRISRGGFRVGWEPSSANSLTLQGDIYDGIAGATYAFPTVSPPYFELVEGETAVSGGNLLTHWTHLFSPTSDASFQVYYDRTERRGALEREDRNTFDFDFQHRYDASWRFELLWGLGYRLSNDKNYGEPHALMVPKSRTDDLYSAFAQVDIAVLKDRLSLILGSKFEHNDYTGFEFQPNGRILWTPHRDHTLWAAISRAVRTPSRVEYGSQISWYTTPPLSLANPTPYPVVLTLVGNPEYESEVLLAHEVGYRFRPEERVSIDLAAFYNTYDKLRITQRRDPIPNFAEGFVTIPIEFTNNLEAETYGLELALDWYLSRNLRARAGYSYLQMDLQPIGETTDTVHVEADGDVPRHQFALQTAADLPKELSLNLQFRYVEALPHLAVDSYVEMDARLGWRVFTSIEVAVVGRNLLHDSHPEFKSELSNVYTEVERDVSVSLVWRF
jgi:iron complex outermembrane receptor protein